MLGSGSIKSGEPGRHRSCRVCPTLSHVSVPGETARNVCQLDTVSGVSLISGNLKLVDASLGGRERHYAPHSPLLVQVGHAQCMARLY
jgi:hypothetical protein